MASSAMTKYLRYRNNMHRARSKFPTVNPTHPGYCPYTMVWYADSVNGLDTNSGHSILQPLKSLDKALLLAAGFGAPFQCIVLMPSGTAYHDDTGESFPCIVTAALDDLTIMSASAVPAPARHTVIGATDEGHDNGLLYSLAENTKLINLTFLSSKTPVYLGTESGHGAGAATTVGALAQGCVFDTGTTSSQPALSLSCTNAIIDGCEIVANGATSDGIIAYDPCTVKNSIVQVLVDGVHLAGGATLNTRVTGCTFEAKPDEANITGYSVNVAVGSNDVTITDCDFAPSPDGDGTDCVGEDDNVFSGKLRVQNCRYVTAVVTPGGGAGDKTTTTASCPSVEAY